AWLCGQLISTAPPSLSLSLAPQHTQAFGKFFHPEHFCCEICNPSFGGGRYYELDGAAYCADHYLTVVSSSKCHKCQRPVPESEAVCVQNNVFHTGCLFCTACGDQLQ